MPQLNPVPWFFYLFLTWFIIIALAPKILAHPYPHPTHVPYIYFRRPLEKRAHHRFPPLTKAPYPWIWPWS